MFYFHITATEIGHKEAAYVLEQMSLHEIQSSTQKYVKAFLNPEVHIMSRYIYTEF
jgi:hypothetical protein